MGEKQTEKIRQLVKRGDSLLSEKKFHEAIELYLTLDKETKKIDLFQEKWLQKKVFLFYKELSVYLRVNEAYALAEMGNLDGLRNELLSLHNLAFELSAEEATPDIIVLLEYANKKYEFFLNVYNYKARIKHFHEKYKRVSMLMEKSKINDALKEYAELILLAHKVMGFLKQETRVQIYYKLKELLKSLAIQRLLTHKRAPETQKELVRNYRKAEEKLVTLRKLIEHGEHNHAYKFYKELQ
ncbi:hypothetical protein HZB00_02495 [Candidatus Woesearchaeota archaeon]|nr:hypothetical protein [Candidatus Woesearchaeota archaeon]